ncbi:type II toxin-antitoxin system VapC family toxin [Nibrella saemangeumensis]|uniref:Type II toxin-antitoxin system VapC family toxin n=1 Tax=Nibrella saemangeumensis TaxID=1084526 RepID=A0ABP8N177_9BACT
MNYLLDTHTLIWAVTEPQKLSTPVRNILEDSGQVILVSAISFWEISLKHSIQKLRLDKLTPEDFEQAAVATGFQLLDLDGSTAASYHKLTATYHRDPFDRMLIWQALQADFTLISKDEIIQKYTSEGLKVVW